MPTSLFQYEMLPTTWFYLSSIMILATFFRFNRFFSVRNFDIIGLIAFTPGLLFISMGEKETGFAWLYAIGVIFVFRLLADSFMIRRPLLEPNLAMSGLVFSNVMLIMFFVPNLLINRGDRVETPRTIRLEQLMAARGFADLQAGKSDPILENPGYRPFFHLSRCIEEVLLPCENIRNQIDALLPRSQFPAQTASFNPLDVTLVSDFYEGEIIAKYGASAEFSDSETGRFPHGSRRSVDEINRERQAEYNAEEEIPRLDEFFLILFILLAQFGTVWGLVAVGHCHFGNLKTGLAAAMVYLLLPYVNQMPGSLENVLPGTLLVLALAIYRRPMFSGFLIGMAGSLVFYPFFLIPLWISFYLKRGLRRFVIGTVSAVLLMGILLMFSPSDYGTYAEQLAAMFGWHSMFLITPTGFWGFVSTYYRIPVIALFMVTAFGLGLWPPQKNLATLISGSALLMLFVQFWMGNLGGLYMGWYLPLLLLTLFRPNLEDRVAQTTVVEI